MLSKHTLDGATVSGNWSCPENYLSTHLIATITKQVKQARIGIRISNNAKLEKTKKLLTFIL